VAHDTFTVSCAAQLRFCFYSLFWMLGNLWLKAMVKSPQQYFSREDIVTRRQHTEWFYLDIGLSARTGMATKEVLTDVGLQAREKGKPTVDRNNLDVFPYLISMDSLLVVSWKSHVDLPAHDIRVQQTHTYCQKKVVERIPPSYSSHLNLHLYFSERELHEDFCTSQKA